MGTVIIDGNGPLLYRPSNDARFGVQSVEDVCQQLSLELNHIFGTVDESHFEVERVVLGQMTARRVRLRAIHVAGLEDALEACDAVFFVELGALGKIRDSIEDI